MKESKIQSECVRWFKNDYVDKLVDNGLIKLEHAKLLRMLYHSNNNELMRFKGIAMPKKVRDLLEGWNRTVMAMGLTSGVADTSLKCEVVIEGVKYSFLEIEYKKPDGLQSPKQVVYQSATVAGGGYYKIIRSVDEFKQFINGIIILC